MEFVYPLVKYGKIHGQENQGDSLLLLVTNQMHKTRWDNIRKAMSKTRGSKASLCSGTEQN